MEFLKDQCWDQFSTTVFTPAAYHSCFYADDVQVYIEMKNIINTEVKVEALLSDIWIWMATCKLKLKMTEK